MKIDTAQLQAAGFEPTRYPGQEGTYYAKRLIARDLPHLRGLIASIDETVSGDEMVVVEVMPGAKVQLSVVGTDYHEEPVAVDSEAGIALLRHAGFR